ncbi:hypothetical protein KNU09_gp62 [Gordonia phage TillyBobJoe]|uniref:Uncharacterized protein n=1 Tax=Gordonia phage TillyBobJoe TaxID=2301560 RepID=A0A385DS65_9CAUD|nr:hypothetical protein KNU09_gp62 [Gordonia phage TillyBobJoe]AXQ62293.1 hypothetical protein SEA_TILLYBOBJOE_62 [Gordonia phage TillyBobJoe]
MTGLTEAQRAAARERRRAIHACRHCDPSGWVIDHDGRARRCPHPGTPPAQETLQLDPTEPRHEPPSRRPDQT